MGIPVAVINFDELISFLVDKLDIIVNGNFNIDNTPIIELLEKYLPQFKDLLEEICDNTAPLVGTPKSKGFRVVSNSVFTPAGNIVLSGVSFFMSKPTTLDTITIRSMGINILEDIYIKDILQDKKFKIVCPIAAGADIEIITNTSNVILVDIDYVEIGVV